MQAETMAGKCTVCGVKRIQEVQVEQSSACDGAKGAEPEGESLPSEAGLANTKVLTLRQHDYDKLFCFAIKQTSNGPPVHL